MGADAGCHLAEGALQIGYASPRQRPGTGIRRFSITLSDEEGQENDRRAALLHGSRLGDLSDRCRAYRQNVRSRLGAGQLSLRRRSVPASSWTGESGAGGSSELVTILGRMRS